MTSPWFHKTRKIQNWRQNLLGVFHQWNSKEFVWGDADCFCFAGACVEAQTGLNPMQGFIGSYDTKKEAYKSLLKGIKGSDGRLYKAEGLEGYIRLFMGQEKPVLTAQRGDVVLIQHEDAKITSIVDDSSTRLVAMTEKDGLVRLPIKMGTMAWSV